MFGRRSNGVGQTYGRKFRIEKLESRLVLNATAPTVSDVSVGSSLWEAAFVDYLDDTGLGSNGYSIPVGSAAQSHPLPWSHLDRISITFSEDVDIQASDLSVSGLTNTWYKIEDFIYDPQSMQATWTLANPLAEEERVHLDLDADGVDPVRDLDGNLLDGEWFDEISSYQSGNGVAGGDFEFRFNVISGDHYATGLVDYHDYYATYYSVGDTIGDLSYQPLYDNDGNGIVQISDWQAVTSNMGAALPVGIPAGVSSDAPTTVGFSLTQISDRNITTQVSLHAAFEDHEDTDTQLTYAIVSQSNSALFESITINSQTGNIELDPSSTGAGRNNIVVSATDSSGLSVSATLPIDLDQVSTPPSILPFDPVSLGNGDWEVRGTVHDDDSVEGLIVALSGLFNTRVVVADDGTFSYQENIDIFTGGDVFAEVTDSTGIESALYSTFVGT